MTELEKKIKKVERTIEILTQEINNFDFEDFTELECAMGLHMSKFDNLMAHRKHEQKRLEKFKKRLTFK